MTRQRLVVLRVLAESREHLDAEAIHERVKDSAPRISLATVYRTLALLKGLGLVNEFKLGEEHGHFEAALRSPHHHFTCLKCHRVIEFSAPHIAEETLRLLEKQGISVTELRLQVSGYCPACQNPAS